MESNEQTELKSKIDKLIDGEQADSSGGWLGVKGLSEKEKGLMDTKSNVVFARGRGLSRSVRGGSGE